MMNDLGLPNANSWLPIDVKKSSSREFGRLQIGKTFYLQAHHFDEQRKIFFVHFLFFTKKYKSPPSKHGCIIDTRTSIDWERNTSWQTIHRNTK